MYVDSVAVSETRFVDMPIGSLRIFYAFGEKADPGRDTAMAYRFRLAAFRRDFTSAFRCVNIEKQKVSSRYIIVFHT